MTKMIRHGEKIGQYDAFLAREMLRQYHKLNEADAELFSALGYLTRSDDGEIQLSESGLKLCAARSKRFKRATGDRVLSEFLARVGEANFNADYLYFVDQLVLFGSMLTESDTIADVDIFVLLARKEKLPKDTSYITLALERAEKAGKKKSMSFNEKICFPMTEVWQYIKGTNPILSLQEWDVAAKEFIANQPHKIIYTWQGER